MEELKNINIQKRVDQYIQGKLSENEIDELWVTFLESPEWFEYFMTILNLYSIGKKRRQN